MMLPLQNITQVITPVMHPIFSDYQNDLQRLGSAYERIMRLLAFIGIPLSVLLFFTAKEVTLIIFGDQWLPSVPVFRILTLSVGVQIILSSSGSIFQAAGDTRSLFICGLFSSLLNVSGMLLGIFGLAHSKQWHGALSLHFVSTSSNAIGRCTASHSNEACGHCCDNSCHLLL